eukprot:5364164-Pyramimonas_sp.AAC.1
MRAGGRSSPGGCECPRSRAPGIPAPEQRGTHSVTRFHIRTFGFRSPSQADPVAVAAWGGFVAAWVGFAAAWGGLTAVWGGFVAA